MKFKLEVDLDKSYRTLGLLIKYNRLINNYSLRDLGLLANISHTMISNIERGKVTASETTLKHLFNVLNLKYYDEDNKIINDFVPKYNEGYNYLCNYEYDKAKTIFEDLIANQKVLANSVVSVDYNIVKYFYLGLINEIHGSELTNLELLLSLAEFLTERQLQMAFFVNGILLYNQGLYKNSLVELKKALNVGDKDLDGFINVFIVKCYFKMFVFMEAIQLANMTISNYETELNYSRAMELRLTIAQSYITVKEYSIAKSIVDKVVRFADRYDAPYLLEECYFLYSKIYLENGEIELARGEIDKCGADGFASVLYLKTKIAVIENNVELAREIYSKFLEQDRIKKSVKDQIYFKILLKEHGLIKISDIKYVKLVEELAEIGKKSCDILTIDKAYSVLIEYYKKKRMYKNALESAESAGRFRNYGCVHKKK